MVSPAAQRFELIRQAAARKEHGSRARYVSGCRCLLCRAANSRYQCSRDLARRNGDTRDLVPADAVRAHVTQLSEQGIGYKAVADAAAVSRSVLRLVLSGRRLRIRQDRERRILAVDCEAVADGARVPAANTWRMLRELIGAGYTRTWIAVQLGSKAKAPKLQFPHDRITAANASKIERLYRLIQAGRISR